MNTHSACVVCRPKKWPRLWSLSLIPKNGLAGATHCIFHGKTSLIPLVTGRTGRAGLQTPSSSCNKYEKLTLSLQRAHRTSHYPEKPARIIESKPVPDFKTYKLNDKSASRYLIEQIAISTGETGPKFPLCNQYLVTECGNSSSN